MTHAPPTHELPTALHGTPHAPHDVLLLDRFVSQPLLALPSQLPNPPLHAPSAHAPFAQVAPAFGNEHAVWQVPHVVGDERSASQPLMGLPSQSAKPGAHAVHVKFAAHPRCRPAIAPLMQSASEQQALQPEAPQQVVPAAHAADVQVPPVQTSDVHASPSLQSLFVQQTAHTPPQLRMPAGHPQTPATQICEPPHALPHAPQFAASVRASTSQPSATRPLQSANPVWQRTPHTPASHVAMLDPAGAVQVVPHTPQLFTSVIVSTHDVPHIASPPAQPLEQPVEPHTGVVPEQAVPHMPQFAGSLAAVVHANVAPHERNPALHWHAPPMHTAWTPHALPHAPQCSESLVVSISQPFIGFASQSANPGEHAHAPATQACPAPHA